MVAAVAVLAVVPVVRKPLRVAVNTGGLLVSFAMAIFKLPGEGEG